MASRRSRPESRGRRRPRGEAREPELDDSAADVAAERSARRARRESSRGRGGPAPEGERPPAPSGRPPRSRSETLARVAVAIPWIVFAIAIVAIGGLPFAIAMGGFAVIGVVELFRMTRAARPIVPVGLAVVVCMALAAHYGDQYEIVLIALASLPLMFAFAASRSARDRQNITYSMAVTVFAIVWIGIPFAHAVLLRDLPNHGDALLIDVLVATFVADTAAYATGRLFGRHPLAPSLSPNKTLEGLAGGFVGGTMGFWFAGLYQDWLPGLDALVMGACIAALAPIGDLFESMIKRDLDVKDSGRAFGPHGGLLDRLDAVLFTVVVGYYLAVAFLY